MTPLYLALVLFTRPGFAAEDWPVFRHDPQLTGCSALVGDIAEPRVIAEHFVGAWEGRFTIDPEPGHRETLATEPLSGDLQDLSRRFGLGANLYDLRGDGELTAMPQQTGRQIGKLLPDVPGLQSVEFDDAFGYRGGERGHLYAYDGKERREVWKTPVEDNMFMPLVLLVDADGDDETEIVVATHYRVMIFDARTGNKDAEIRIHGYRNYGFFGAEDLDGDGLPEYVIITDFSSHMDVVDYVDGKLSLLWRRDIDPDITSRSKVVRVGPQPIVDIDGDGRFELVFNLFSDSGDGQWHVVAYDALTGETKWDIPRKFLHGMTGFGQQERPLLLTVDTEGIPLPRWGDLRILRVGEGKVAQLWHTRRARWQQWDLPSLPPSRNTGATLGRRTCLVDEASGSFYIARPGYGAHTVLCAMAWNSGSPKERWRAMGPGLEAVAARDVDEDGVPELLARLRSAGPDARIEVSGGDARLISMRSAGARPTSPIAADLNQDGRPELVLNDGAGGIIALSCDSDPQAGKLDLQTLWRVPGRAMADSQTQWYGVQAADVDQDGQLEVMVGGCDDRGQAELRVLDGTGAIEWSRTFPHIDGSNPVWNRGCLTYWSIVQIGGRPHVYASVRRSLMHSDESYLLAGSDGAVLWHVDKIQCPHAVRAVGGKMVAVRDINSDGDEDIIITYPDVLLALNGRTGEALIAHPTTGDDLPGWTAYAVPIVADADADDTDEIYWTACTYITAAFDLTGTIAWHSEYKDGVYVQGCWTLPAMADVNADGRLELVGSGYSDGLRVYDAATGRLLANTKFASPTGPAASADIDGDGRHEAIIPSAEGLHAVGMGADGARTLWRLKMPAVPSAPILADLDSDGKAEIAVVCADGYLRIIDGRR